MQPDAFLLQTAEEALDQPILLWRVGRDEFLAQTILSARLAESATLEDEAVIQPDDRSRPCALEGTESLQARFLECTLSFLGSPSQSQLVPTTSRSWQSITATR